MPVPFTESEAYLEVRDIQAERFKQRAEELLSLPTMTGRIFWRECSSFSYELARQLAHWADHNNPELSRLIGEHCSISPDAPVWDF